MKPIFFNKVFKKQIKYSLIAFVSSTYKGIGRATSGHNKGEDRGAPL